MTEEEKLRARSLGINGEFDCGIKSHSLADSKTMQGGRMSLNESHKRLSDILLVDTSLLYEIVTNATGLVSFTLFIDTREESLR